MTTRVFDTLLAQLQLRPVLMDIGASGAPPAIWEAIARHSIFVGFDPDQRELHHPAHGRFHRAIVVREAITADPATDHVQFYFTKSPFCSSTLKPDSQSLSNFLFSHLFVVEGEGRVPATTLDTILQRFTLGRLDWLKVDTQGTDLRIINSVGDERRSRILAVDIEPGLIDAYLGEDMFVDAHRDLTRQGFWLSNLSIHGAVRLRRSTIGEVAPRNKDLGPELLESTLKKTPAWCEARYLRTLQWLADGNFTPGDYVLLWIFALLDNQLGFAIDLGLEYEKAFGKDTFSHVMKEEPVLLIRRFHRRMQLGAAKGFPWRVMRGIKELWRANLSRAG